MGGRPFQKGSRRVQSSFQGVRCSISGKKSSRLVGFRSFSNETALARVFCRFLAPQLPERNVVPQKYGGFGMHFTVSRGKTATSASVFFRDSLTEPV
jgi:hypothetical protein